MRKRCQNQYFDDFSKICIFLNVLLKQPKLLLDTTAIGSLMTKSIEDAILIIQIMTLNDPRIQYIIGTSQKKLRALKMNTCDNMLAQNKLLMQTMEKISKKLSKFSHKFIEIQESSGMPKQILFVSHV